MQTSPDVQVHDMAFDTNPTGGDPPLAMLVYRVTAELSDAWLEKMVKIGLNAGASKFPVDVTYEGSQFVANGAEVTLKAGSGFLKASATICLEVAGAGPNRIMIKVAEIRALGMLPVESFLNPVMEKGIDRACEKPGITRHPVQPRTVVVDPNVLLQTQGVQLQFADGGQWNVNGQPGSLTMTFKS